MTGQFTKALVKSDAKTIACFSVVRFSETGNFLSYSPKHSFLTFSPSFSCVLFLTENIISLQNTVLERSWTIFFLIIAYYLWNSDSSFVRLHIFFSNDHKQFTILVSEEELIKMSTYSCTRPYWLWLHLFWIM